MYKIFYVWLLWVVLLPLCTLVQTGGPIYAGMLLIYDAIDTSLWEVNPETLEASLWLDFEAAPLSINPIAFRVDKQSIIYFRVPPVHARGARAFELIERDIVSGIEFSIMSAQWLITSPMPSNDARLVAIVEGEDTRYCVLSFVTNICNSAAQELVNFIKNVSVVWQNDAGYVLTEQALYHFDLHTMSWELLIEDAWHLARTAAYVEGINKLYIAGYRDAPQGRCGSSQLMLLDLDSFELELAGFELPDCISRFDTMLISPDGRYLQYDSQDVVVIDLETGEVVYRPFWYSDRAIWLDDSQNLLFTYYEQAGTSGNRVMRVNIIAGNLEQVYEGHAGFVSLYEIP